MIENLSYSSIENQDFDAICKLPESSEKLFFMFPKAEYPLTVNQLGSAVESRLDSTVISHGKEIVGFANFYMVFCPQKVLSDFQTFTPVQTFVFPRPAPSRRTLCVMPDDYG